MSELLSSYLHAAPFLALGVLFLLLNLAAALTRRSGIPLLGTAFGVTGCLMHADLRPYLWLFIVLDLGTLRFLRELPAILRREKRYLKKDRLAEFGLGDEQRRVTLELFASGACRLHFAFHRPPGSTGLVSSGLLGRWKIGGNKKERHLILQIEESESGRYDFVAEGEPVQLHCREEKHPLGQREAAARLTGSRFELLSGKFPKINPPPG